MKLIISICFFLVLELAKGDNYEVNEGASTSGSGSGGSSNSGSGSGSTSRDNNDEEQLSNFETCEINEYVNTALGLVAQDLFSPNNRSINYAIDQLTLSVTYSRLVSSRLRYGQSYSGDHDLAPMLPNFRQRRDYFTSRALDIVLERVLELNRTRCFSSRDYQNATLRYNNLMFMELNNYDLHTLIVRILMRIGLTIEEITRIELTSLTNTLQRRGRSVTQKEEKCYPIIKFSYHRWNEFFVYLSSTFIKLLGEHELAPWFCDYMSLYDEYYKYHMLLENFNDICSNTTFNSFLYAKISRLQDWNDCMDFGKSKQPNDWCRAWRRIMLNSNTGSFGSLANNKHPEKFHSDLKTMIKWLLKKVTVKNPIEAPSKNIKVNSLACFESSTSLSCPNYCNNKVISARSKRAYSLPEDIMYEREWLKDVDNKLRCRCPEDNNTSVISTTPRSGNWFSRLFGETKCARNSPDYETPRCDELRRKRSPN